VIEDDANDILFMGTAIRANRQACLTTRGPFRGPALTLGQPRMGWKFSVT
jgi:hypothetical protein